eukprot:10223629-Prorocentrum_lima.AAC.1
MSVLTQEFRDILPFVLAWGQQCHLQCCPNSVAANKTLLNVAKVVNKPTSKPKKVKVSPLSVPSTWTPGE